MPRPAARDPLALLKADRARAVEARDPCANLCTVASLDRDGQPQARTLVLREVEGGFAVFSNRTSPKWAQLESGASIAVVVWLPTLNLQYRLQCTARPVPPEIVRASWLLRPDMPKRLDWYYTQGHPQGAPIAGRAELMAGLGCIELPDPLVAPDTAGGLYVDPFRIDRLDLAQADGLHDRRLFESTPAGWTETTLVP